MAKKNTSWKSRCLRLLGMLVVLFPATTLQSQTWHPFPANGPHLYTFSQQGSADNWFFAANVDSVVVEGAPMPHYFYRMDRPVMPSDSQLTCGGSVLGSITGSYALEQDHCFGRKMLEFPDGVCLFVSSRGDSFRLETRAAIGNSWTWQGAVTAQVDSIVFRTVLGVPDSVKYMSFSTGKRLALSRTHGFVETFSFLPFVNFGGWVEFPAFELWGLPALGLGGSLPTYAQIFDWDPGDHFGYRYSELSFPATDSGYFSTEVNALVPGSRFSYAVVQEQLQFYQFAAQAMDTNYIAPAPDTISFDSLAYLRLGLLPYQHNPAVKTLLSDYCQNGMRSMAGTNGSIRMDFLKTTFYDSCANAMIPMDADWSQSFANGLGEIESSYNSVGGYAWRRIYCYAKGSETWGTCRDLSTIIGIESPETSLFSIAPNPATEVITLRLSAVAKTPLQVRILNSLGEFEAESTLVAGSRSLQVDVSKLPAGLHLLQIEGSGRTMAVRRIVVAR